MACGIKHSAGADLGLLVCDSPAPVSAARFTASSTAAAPVLLSRGRCELSRLRAVLVNSGCANAATGNRGLEDAAKTQGAAAVAAGVGEAEVAVASTGGISQYLPVEKMLRGILEASAQLRADGAGAFQRAIQTTDAFEKRANVEVALPSGTVQIAAQCKGAGMISPRFATMLCFVQTDAVLSAQTADLLLGVCVKRSFDRCSVDGQLSTNDTAILMSSGASGMRDRARKRGRAAVRPGAGRAAALAGDHDRCRRRGRRADRARARAGRRARRRSVAVEPVARAIANSPLIKAALHGGDPNWGRIVQAAGAALPGVVPLALDVSIEGVPVCAGGAALDVDERELARAVQGTEIEYEVALPGEGFETEVFFSDLSHDYVKLNAEYMT